MGYKFSLVLNRELSDDESTALTSAIRADASFDADRLPTNAEVPVTKIDVDDTVSPTLAAAIEAAFEAVRTVEGLTIPGLSVPAQPAGPVDDADADSDSDAGLDGVDTAATTAETADSAA